MNSSTKPMKSIVCMLSALGLSLAVSNPALAADCPEAAWAEGVWQGQIEGAGTITVFRIGQDDDGCLEATMDQPEHGAERLPLGEVGVQEGQVIHLQSDGLDFIYIGRYQGGRIEGQFQQRGAVFVLDLDRIE